MGRKKNNHQRGDSTDQEEDKEYEKRKVSTLSWLCAHNYFSHTHGQAKTEQIKRNAKGVSVRFLPDMELTMLLKTPLKVDRLDEYSDGS